MAGKAHLVPFRTQKLSSRAPMVLRRKSVGEQDVADQQGAFAILRSYISRQFILGCISPCAYLVPAVLTACLLLALFACFFTYSGILPLWAVFFENTVRPRFASLGNIGEIAHLVVIQITTKRSNRYKTTSKHTFYFQKPPVNDPFAKELEKTSITGDF